MISAGELFGGVERHLLGMCEWLGSRGVDPLLILFHEKELAQQARAQGIDPVILDNRGSLDLGVPGRLAALLARRGVNVVHAHGYKAVVNTALARLRYRFVTVRTLHGLVEPSRPMTTTWLKSHVYDALESFAASRSHSIDCYVTDDLRRRRNGRKSAGGRQTRVVFNGIDGSAVRPRKRPDDLPAGEFHFAAVGRVSPVKGLGTALRAMKGLDCQANPVLNIIGTGPSLPELQSMAAALGVDSRVRFLGFRDNIYDYLAHIDVLVMPSRHEGLPYTILEAMSLGTPIVAARVGGLAEVLADGKTAVLVDPDDLDRWTREMNRLMHSVEARESLGSRAQAEQARSYTLATMGAAYWKIYQDGLAEAAGTSI